MRHSKRAKRAVSLMIRPVAHAAYIESRSETPHGRVRDATRALMRYGLCRDETAMRKRVQRWSREWGWRDHHTSRYEREAIRLNDDGGWPERNRLRCVLKAIHER